MSTDTTAMMAGLGEQYLALAHNLANVNTVGYKRRVSHYAAVAATPAGTGPAASALAGGGAGPGRASMATDFSQGRLVRTGRSLDLALSGKGFFVLETDQGERYTRNGVFRVNADGHLVDGQGRTVAGEGGPVTVPTSVSPMEVDVASDGRLLAAGAPIGRLRLVAFEDVSGLESEGFGAFAAPNGVQPTAATDTTVEQGFQEASNVDAVTELVGLIQVTRLYEANVQVLMQRKGTGQDLLRVAMA